MTVNGKMNAYIDSYINNYRKPLNKKLVTLKRSNVPD